ncbi:MAG: Sau3AI family type II restriction endonuclease, partial [Tannerellaceae bacterium]
EEIQASSTGLNKGELGQLIEEHYFKYACNSDQRADFHKVGIELKVTPFRINNKKEKVAKERLVLTMINYHNVIHENFYESHAWSKAKSLLLIYYFHDESITNSIDYKIHYVSLYQPSKEDLNIIEQDYNKITNKIRLGLAHELSEGDTLYLGAATKASTGSVRKSQPNSDYPAKPRAFALKNSYMTYVLNHYVVNKNQNIEQIYLKNENLSFEENIVRNIQAYAGNTLSNICDMFGFDSSKKPKNIEALLTYRILGIKGNKAEEFQKANIRIKTIRIGYNGKIKESMSFPSFKFLSLVNETWETSEFREYLEESRFLFVVYQYNAENELVLKGCQFWNIPYSDLHDEVYRVWRKTIDVLKAGLVVEERNGIRYTNFPKMVDNRVSHVRPHGTNKEDTYELPDGRFYTKHCFWLNSNYILSQISSELIDKKNLIFTKLSI